MSLHTGFLPLFQNAARLIKTLTRGRESNRQVQDLASEVGGGEQQRSCSPETSLQRYEMARYREEGTTHWNWNLAVLTRRIFFSSRSKPSTWNSAFTFCALQGQTVDKLHLLRRRNN